MNPNVNNNNNVRMNDYARNSANSNPIMQNMNIPNTNMQNTNQNTSNLKNQNSLDWTSNNTYKPAYPVCLRTTFAINKTNQSPIINSNINLNDLMIVDNSRISDYRSYEREILEKKSKSINAISKSKKQFIEIFMGDTQIKPDSEKSEFLGKIKEKLGYIIESNENLKTKLSKYSSYYNKSSFNEHKKSNSNVDDFSIFSNNNVTFSPPSKTNSQNKVGMSADNNFYENGSKDSNNNIYGINFNNNTNNSYINNNNSNNINNEVVTNIYGKQFPTNKNYYYN